MRLYSLFDRKAEAFNKPFPSQTDGTAMRDIGEGLKDAAQRAHALDFVLFNVGEFDPSTGRCEVDISHPRHVIDCIELVRMSDQDVDRERQKLREDFLRLEHNGAEPPNESPSE